MISSRVKSFSDMRLRPAMDGAFTTVDRSVVYAREAMAAPAWLRATWRRDRDSNMIKEFECADVCVSAHAER